MELLELAELIRNYYPDKAKEISATLELLTQLSDQKNRLKSPTNQ